MKVFLSVIILVVSMWVKGGNTPGVGGGVEWVLPYMGYIGICCCEGYGFQACSVVWNSQGYKSCTVSSINN